ncbi:unnamed protein product [Symbiodinium sp. CCMP2592]|nr:unnamed protein product [Symbiodinium sp. CCMP2592]
MDWSLGVHGPDQKIYCVPDTATQVLCYDPLTGQSSCFGAETIDVGSHKWSGGVLAKDGKIYCVPWTHPQVLVIHCEAKRVSFLDTSTGTGCTAASLSEHKWRDGILSEDGWAIYCIPWTAEAVLRIDVAKGSASCFGELPAGDSKWAGAAVGSDGRIYCAPYDSASCLVIAPGPGEPTASLLGHFGDLRRKWRGAVATPGGEQIYMIPYNALEVLVVEPEAVPAAGVAAHLTPSPSLAPRPADAKDPQQVAQAGWAQARALARFGVEPEDHLEPDEAAPAEPAESVEPAEVKAPTAGFSKLGWVGGIRCKWRGGVLAKDGYIYCVPDCACEVLCIRPASQDVLLFGEVGSARWKWRGGVLAWAPQGLASVRSAQRRGDRAERRGLSSCSRLWRHEGRDGKVYCALGARVLAALSAIGFVSFVEASCRPYESHESVLVIDPATLKTSPLPPKATL